MSRALVNVAGQAIVAWVALILIALPVFSQSGRAKTLATAVQNPEFSSHESLSPELLSFDELAELSSTAQPTGTLATKLEVLLSTPKVSNEASASGAQPHRPEVANLGPVARVALWNIERGLNFDLIRVALSGPDEFERIAPSAPQISDARKSLIKSQLETLADADVLILNEVDWGMKRTNYRDVARDLASALHMNYAYGVEFVEVDPIFELGIEKIRLEDPQDDARLQNDLQVDRNRYLGLHGTAILSRYPIENARIFRLPVCYDWYGKEAAAAAKLEKGKRWAARALFRERIEREIRHGGRMALIADVAIPEAPGGHATVVATHLENRCAPACRRRQIQALLDRVREIKNPVVLAGDLNTTGTDHTPTSLRYEIMSRVTDYQFWAGQVVSHFHPLGMYQIALVPVHYFHGYNDPTAFHVPIVWKNQERRLFKTMEKFRFDDGQAFDFRGDPERSLKARGSTLSDSNERAAKGFVPTCSFARDYRGLFGRFKLDWFFVKPYIDDARRAGEDDLFAPRLAETLRALNESVENRISDHAPLTVDLPLLEPRSGNEGSRGAWF